MRQLATSLTFLVLAAACGRGGAGGPHAVGQTSFESPAPWGGGGAPGDATAGAAPGAPAPATSTPAAGGNAAAARTVEEADIYALSGSTLLVLNAYRGLQTVDLSDLARPRLLARVPVVGRPVDLYLRGTTAFVAVTDTFVYVTDAGAARPDRGSRLLAVDVADPAAPRVVADLPVDGEVTDTRLVGDVLYVVSRDAVGWRWVGFANAPVATAGVGVAAPAGADSATVTSFDVADPSRPREVARLTFDAGGWSTHAHVTATRITLAFAGWDAAGPSTRFQAVDISDPAGALAKGAAFQAAGQVQDRWALDHDDARGLFRAVLAAGWNGGAALATWSSPSPGAFELLSRLPIDVQESLTAARFDGDRVYLVTARRTDPLWAVDATDPRAPRVAGALHMPGQLDFIEPRGDRLVALGHTSEAGQPFQLAVSLIDVTRLDAPALLARQTFGGGYGWVNARPDDLRKAFIVLDPPADGAAPGLVLVPLEGWDPGSWRAVAGTQLLDWSRDVLALRGFLSHAGEIARAFPLDAARTRLAALSDGSLQTIDATDRGAPAQLGEVELSRSTWQLALSPSATVQLAGDYWRGDTELVTTPLADPDGAALGRVHVPAPYAQLFQDGAVAWLAARDWTSNAAWLQAVDVVDPASPRARGRLDLSPDDAVAGGTIPWWGWGDEVVRVGHVLAVHRTFWGNGAGTGEVHLFDLADPDRPRAAGRAVLPAGWSWGLRAVGANLWLTHFDPGPEPAPMGGGTSAQRGRYFLDRIDVSDPADPKLLAGVNVPGIFAGASEDGRTVYTLETFWPERGADTAVSWLHALGLRDDGLAELRGSARLEGYPEGVAFSAGAAWALTSTWSFTAPARQRLHAVDLGAMAVVSAQDVGAQAGWLQAMAGGKLFLQASWYDTGVLVYDLADPLHPAFDRFVRTPGWVQDVVVGGGRAYLPAGPYGVTVVPLGPTNTQPRATTASR